MKDTIYQIFEDINKAEFPVLEMAKHTTDTVFHMFINLIFASNEKWSSDIGVLMPESVKHDFNLHPDFASNFLRFSYKQLYIFMESKEVDSKIRVKRWEEYLSALHITEANLILQIRNGYFFDAYPNITVDVVKEVFPMTQVNVNPIDRSTATKQKLADAITTELEKVRSAVDAINEPLSGIDLAVKELSTTPAGEIHSTIFEDGAGIQLMNGPTGKIFNIGVTTPAMFSDTDTSTTDEKSPVDVPSEDVKEVATPKKRGRKPKA